MKKAWSEFWKDYKDMDIDGLKFYKKHWKGTIVLCFITFVVTYGFGHLIGTLASKKNQIDHNFDLSNYMNEPVNDIHKEGEEE